MKACCILILFALLFTACSENTSISTQGIENSIPASSKAVLLINSGQLMKKADYASLKNTNMFSDAIEDMKNDIPQLAQILEDPNSMGINMDLNIGMFSEIESLDPDQMGLSMILPIGDPKLFDEKLKTLLKDIKSDEKNGRITYLLSPKAKLIHDDKIALITSISDEQKINEIFNPTSSNITTDANFAKHFKEGKDFMVWFQLDELIDQSLKASGMQDEVVSGLALMQLDEKILKDNYLSAYYDFAQGEIDAGLHIDPSELMKEEVLVMLPEGSSTDFSKYISDDGLAGVFTMSLDLDKIVEFAAKRGYDKMADQYLNFLDLNLDKIRSYLKIEMAAAIYPKDGEPDFLMALGIKDQENVTKLIEKYGLFMGLSKQGDYFVLPGQEPMDPSDERMDIFISVKEDVILVSNDKTKIKGQSVANNQIISELQKGWMGSYWNEKLLSESGLSGGAMIPLDNGMDQALNAIMKYNEMKGIKILADKTNISMKVELKNKDQNSLKTILDVLEKLYKEKDSLLESMEEEFDLDEFDNFDQSFEENI